MTTAQDVFVAYGEHLVAGGDLIVTAEELARETTPDAKRRLIQAKARNAEFAIVEHLRALGYEVA